MFSFACHSLAGRLVTAALLLALLPSGPTCAADRPGAPVPHIRAVNPELLSEIREGCRRSPTFRALLERLEQSDLVVYFESVRDTPPLTKAYTRWVGASATLRFVRVAVKIPASTDTIIVLLGHELQHANEVADARDVRSEAEFAALYRRIGDQSPGGWDTAAARLAGTLVRDEVRSFVDVKPDAASAAPAVSPALSPKIRR